jgi:cytochrome P450
MTRPTTPLFGPDFTADPYAVYDRFRATHPVLWVPMPIHGHPGFWFLSRHADVTAVLKSPAFGWEVHKKLGGKPPAVPGQQPLLDLLAKWMTFRDPPDHTRLRGLVNRAFTPGVVEQLVPRIRAAADVLLDRAAARGPTLEVVHDLAFPLTTLVIAELLGIPVPDREKFQEWSKRLERAVDLGRKLDAIAPGTEAAVAMTAYFRQIVDERREQRGDDLLSSLLDVEDEGDRLTTEELIATCILLMFAGHETTTNLITNGVLCLLRHPDQAARLRADPGLMRSAVEECLRYESPLQIIFRHAFEDAEISGRKVRATQLIGLGLGAANRDPAVFPEPNTFDIGRTPNPHVAFGVGIHYCVGAPLSKVETQVVFRAMLDRWPNLRLAREPEWQAGRVMLRGPKSLEVELLP